MSELLAPKERKIIRDKVYPWDEAVPMNADLAGLLDRTQAKTAEAQLAKFKGYKSPKEVEEAIKEERERIIAWLFEDCNEHPAPIYPTGVGFEMRIDCPECRQTLKDKP